LKVTFWGTRGSIAKPGPTTARYGGNTSCIEVRSSSGTLVVIDCGTGSHGLGQALMAQGVTRGCLLIGHTHWDHIQGLPFFAPLFARNNEWDVCGPKGLSGSLRETLAGQMESTYFPVALESLGATIRYWDLLQGTFYIDDIKVTTHHLNHPALTLAFRLEADGASIVYACDHECYAHEAADGSVRLEGPDLRHAEFAAGADLLIHDAQYTAAEYPKKVNWGHSTVEYAMRVAREAGVQQLALTHHDPLRTDDDLDLVLENARAAMLAAGSRIKVIAAAEGETIEVTRQALPFPVSEPLVTAEPELDTTESRHIALVCVRDPLVAELVADAIRSDRSIRIVNVATIDDVRAASANGRPAVAIFEQAPGHDVLAMCREIAIDRADDRRRMPVLVVADREYPHDENSGVDEWLVGQLSSTYTQAKLQAWVHRGISRWRKAPIPADEERRLATLYSLGLLDTPPDSRFDRITRLASRLFAVPIVHLTLIDRHRQWFKSVVGAQDLESSRETSFSAHAVFNRATLVVNDALVDDRFAENPHVVDAPRVRFYAGAPLILDDGTCIGTLCLLDTRPRWFATADIHLLEDLRDLAVSEIEHDRLVALTASSATSAAASEIG
jgi:ribonuclease BN (tRNA processing enzyme)